MSAGDCPRCGCELHEAEPDVGILSPGCPDCHWFEGEPLELDESDDVRETFAFDPETDIEPGPEPMTEAEQVGDPGFSFGGPR